MGLLVVALMLAAGIAAIVVAAQGTQGQIYQAITGHSLDSSSGFAGGLAAGAGNLLGGLGSLPVDPILGVPAFGPTGGTGAAGVVHRGLTGGGTLQ